MIGARSSDEPLATGAGAGVGTTDWTSEARSSGSRCDSVAAAGFFFDKSAMRTTAARMIRATVALRRPPEPPKNSWRNVGLPIIRASGHCAQQPYVLPPLFHWTSLLT